MVKMLRLQVITGTFLCLLMLPGCTEDYIGVVVAHLRPQPVDSIRRVLLASDDFKGSRRIHGNDNKPNCSYYAKRSKDLHFEIGMTECYGDTNRSDTGWGYWVIVTSGPWTRPEVEEEVKSTLRSIEATLKSVVGEAKVTVIMMK